MTPIRSLAMVLMTLSWPVVAFAQDAADAEADSAREEARRLLHDARAHADEGRHAMAAERYLELHAFMREHRMERAPVALWTAGQSLAQLPGREDDAIRTLRQFLDESTVLTDDAEIRDWRSSAVSLIDELEARRVGPEPSVTDDDSAQAEAGPTTENGRTISPVGPIVLGVGAAAVVAGIIVGALGVAQDDDLTGQCPTRMDCPPELESRYDEAQTLAGVGDGLWIGGAVVASVGLVLTLVLTEDDAEASTGTTVSVRCGPTGCSVGGRF